MLVSPLPLVGGVLGQSDVNLGLELIAKVTVLKLKQKQPTLKNTTTLGLNETLSLDLLNMLLYEESI